MYYQVSVVQGAGRVSLDFKNLTDAMEFASVCMECGREETSILVTKVEEE